ncbi:hypothetical protein D3C73_1226930 [compost metagenome]
MTGITCNPGLRVGRLELCRCCVRRRFDLIVGRPGNDALGCQIAVSRFVCGGLRALRSGRDDGLLLGGRCQIQIDGINPIEHVAALYRLPRLNQALGDLATHPKGQITLYACGDGSCERARASRPRLHLGNPDDGRSGPGIDVIRRSAGHKEQRSNTVEGCDYKTATHAAFRSGVSGGILFLVTNIVNSH